jgi:hypothetical protein
MQSSITADISAKQAVPPAIGPHAPELLFRFLRV